ncbi:MAG: NfeD family protein [Richelia sp. RM2_1_2]|nr:NfeD family protein [Richelia sp. SM2_1_7]NJM20750.1 NfeD family protein [Richelia sp. SM1_7_0]NJN10098.1 NfeD family protein [Richelia sp. RM1_1_1]NJO29881.1 NfeD family protein [Richelia sp. SL_2_1]NJO56817.1 NfeD family protein [Richelia sp. RM2_1_2]
MMSTTLIWLIVGACLCLSELFIPTAFVAFMMGLSAFIVALLSLVLGNLWLQALSWLLLSTTLILLTRKYISQPRRRSKMRDAVLAETITEIAPGKTGRVLYEGNSWQARCDDDNAFIAAAQRVYVVRREGTTLIVMPENILHS